MTSSSSAPANSRHYSFKILLIGDTGVGKSSLLVSFISNHLVDQDLSPTIGARSKLSLPSLHNVFPAFLRIPRRFGILDQSVGFRFIKTFSLGLF